MIDPEELRARDIYRQLPPRPVVGHALVSRVGRRGWAAPDWAGTHARFFRRCGVPDPFDPGAEDTGVGLGEVGLAQTKRQPAPHALPPEPKKPAAPKLPNVPAAPKPAAAPSAEGKTAPRIGETRRDDTADLKRKLDEKERARRGAPPVERYRVNQPVARLPVRPELAGGEGGGLPPTVIPRPGSAPAAASARPGSPPRPIPSAPPGGAPRPPNAAASLRPAAPSAPAASPAPRPAAPPAPVHAASARTEAPPPPPPAPPASPRVLTARDDDDFGDPFAAGARVVRPSSVLESAPAAPPSTTSPARPAAPTPPESPPRPVAPAPAAPRADAPAADSRSPIPRPAPPSAPASPVNRAPPKPGGGSGGLDDLFGMGADTRIRMPRKEEPADAPRPRRPVVTDDRTLAAAGVDRRPPPPKPPTVTPTSGGAAPGPDEEPDE